MVSARMSFELATYLSQRSVRVTVICPLPSRPIEASYSLYKDRDTPVIIQEGTINVVRLPSYSAPRSKLINRFIESYSFGKHAIRFMSKHKEIPNAIYINSWPLISQAIITRFGSTKNIPIILQIMDIYPESIFNKLSNKFLKILFYPVFFLDKWTAQHATKLIVISNNMRLTYMNHRKIPENKIEMINTWQDDTLFRQLPSRKEGCSHYNIPLNKFTFLYLGNIGPVAGVDSLIRGFSQAGIEKTQLLIVGDGSEKGHCIQLVEQLNSSNIRFITDPDVKNVPLLQSMAHVCLLPLRPGAGLSSIPSKLSSYMFSGKPVLSNVDGSSDTARTIHLAKCGWVGDPEDMEWLVDKMQEIANKPSSELREIGQNGRTYALKHFAKSTGVKNLAKNILEVFDSPNMN